MHEPFGDRAMCELDDREHGACAATGLEAGPAGSAASATRSLHVDAPRSDPAGERQVGGRGRADAQAVGMERPVAGARECVGGRLLLPDDLEGSLRPQT